VGRAQWWTGSTLGGVSGTAGEDLVTSENISNIFTTFPKIFVPWDCIYIT